MRWKRETRRQSLRSQTMIVTVVLCMCALLIQGCLLVCTSVRVYSEKVYEDMEFFLQTCNSNFSNKMMYIENVVNSLRSDPMMEAFFSSDSFSRIEIKQQFDFCTNIVSEQNLIDSREPFVNEIYLFNQHGSYLKECYYSLPNDEQKAHDCFYEALYETYCDEADIHFRLTDEVLYLISPFYGQKMQKCGMILVGIDRLALEQLLSEIDRYGGAFSVLIGMDDAQTLQHNCSLEEESLSQLQELAGRLQLLVLDGTQYLIMPGSGSFHLRMISAVPRQQVYSTVAPLMRLLVCLIIVLVPLAAIAASLAIWRTTMPMKTMTDKIRLFGKGNLDVQMEPTGIVEFDEMSAVFNEMTGKIHSLIGQISENRFLTAQLQIKYLQSQINPHFLFNVLTSISLEAKMDGNEEVYQMIYGLSRLLQGKIFRQNSIKIQLCEELEIVRYYLYLQGYRFQDRLSYHCECEDETLLDCLVPRLCVEPLVENAILHGIEPKKTAGHVRVTVRREGAVLIIEVCDDGVGFHTEQESDDRHSHVALHNIERLIENLYGTGYGLEIKSEENRGTCVWLRLPVEKG